MLIQFNLCRIYLNHSSGMFFFVTNDEPADDGADSSTSSLRVTHTQTNNISLGLWALTFGPVAPKSFSRIESVAAAEVNPHSESGAARRDALRRSLLFTRTMGKIIVCSWFYLVDRTVITILTALCFYSFLANRTQQSSMEMLAK